MQADCVEDVQCTGWTMWRVEIVERRRCEGHIVWRVADVEVQSVRRWCGGWTLGGIDGVNGRQSVE